MCKADTYLVSERILEGVKKCHLDSPESILKMGRNTFLCSFLSANGRKSYVMVGAPEVILDPVLRNESYT